MDRGKTVEAQENFFYKFSTAINQGKKAEGDSFIIWVIRVVE